MPTCADARIDFGRFGRRVTEAEFSGGDPSSDGGLLLDVICGQAMLACVLRLSKVGCAWHAAAVVKLLAGRLRRVWPATRFIVRADSGFCRHHLRSSFKTHPVGAW